MENKLNVETKNSEKFFQSDFLLDDKDAIFVYDLEQIIKKDRLYKLIREINDIYINLNFFQSEKFLLEKKFIYNQFIIKTNFIVDFINKKDVIKQFLLENDQLPNWEEFTQLSKWINSDESDLKRGSIFIQDLEASIFKKKFIDQLKIKKEFINSHIFLCLNISWKYYLKYKPLDFQALFLTSMNALYNLIDDFLESLKLIKKNYLERWEKGELTNYEIYKEQQFEPIPGIEFDSCLYADEFLNAYLNFVDESENNIESDILNYLINHIEVSEKNELVFQR